MIKINNYLNNYLRLTKELPNIITLANLTLGFFSIKLTLMGLFYWALVFIIAGMFLDGLDGTTARRFNVVNDFGKQLDSLSDMVSFGVAPAVLFWANLSTELYWPGIIIAAFPVCGAYRLARFNLKRDNSMFFSGFPITTAGGLLAVVSFYSDLFSEVVLFLLVLVFSITMVTKIPYCTLKCINLKYVNRFNKTRLICLIAPVIIVSMFFPPLLAVILGGYFFTGLINLFVKPSPGKSVR